MHNETQIPNVKTNVQKILNFPYFSKRKITRNLIKPLTKQKKNQNKNLLNYLNIQPN